MRLWRITRSKHQALDGEGARMHGGRWNSEGLAVIYAASTASLAALEMLVHIDVEDVPADLVLTELDVPEDASIIEIGLNDLPADWNAIPDHPECLRRGNEWIASRSTLLLKVPSAVMPRESNVLINPEHSDFARVGVSSSESFSFDPRLVE
jgi:RES domain-containing protein